MFVLDRIDQLAGVHAHRIIIAKVQEGPGCSGLLSDIGVAILSGNRGVPVSLIEQMEPVIHRTGKHRFDVVEST